MASMCVCEWERYLTHLCTCYISLSNTENWLFVFCRFKGVSLGLGFCAWCNHYKIIVLFLHLFSYFRRIITLHERIYETSLVKVSAVDKRKRENEPGLRNECLLYLFKKKSFLKCTEDRHVILQSIIVLCLPSPSLLLSCPEFHFLWYN